MGDAKPQTRVGMAKVNRSTNSRSENASYIIVTFCELFGLGGYFIGLNVVRLRFRMILRRATDGNRPAISHIDIVPVSQRALFGMAGAGSVPVQSPWTHHEYETN
jgi:hypothetical protein